MSDALCSMPSERAKFLAELPSTPGVYQMFDSSGLILYVGKASHLKKRVSSYFNSHGQSPKTKSLVSQIHHIQISVTRTENEALLLESNLIKALRPKYNVLMRDDKTYPFIHIDADHDFPRIEIKRCKKKPLKGDFFGPYPSALAVRETVALIQKIFKLRSCTDAFFSARTRPCLQYQIKRCSAPCTAYITQAAYGKALTHAKLFLQGKSQAILDELADKMQHAVARLAFEEAALLRDQIKHLRLIQEQQSVTHARGDADVIVLEARPGFACVQCVNIRHGEVLGNEHFFPKVPQHGLEEEPDTLWEKVFEAFIRYYYLDMPERIPDLIVTHHPVQESTLLAETLTRLRGQRCRLVTNPRGPRARWIDFALDNLRLSMTKYDKSASVMQSNWQALQLFLACPHPLSRIECVDISHTQGTSAVASCVVFDEQGARKRDYRRFNITGITPGDDCAAIEQMLRRRYQRLLLDHALPDVLMIDGGKGQVAAAERVLAELGIDRVILFGIVKGPGRKAGLERFIFPQQNTLSAKPLVHPSGSVSKVPREKQLPADSDLLHWLQHIRDEAHRFAITAHRKKRQAASLQSSLQDIAGIGPKRRQALLHRFGGWRELSKASVDELSKVSGVSQALAMRIFAHFHAE